MAYFRRLSPLEKLTHVGFPQEQAAQHVNSFVVEGASCTGQSKFSKQSNPLIKQDWEQAVKTLRNTHVGAQLKLKGYSMFSHWDDTGLPPQVIELDASNWDGRTLHNANFLHRPLDIRIGQCSELLLLQGPTPRVLLRTHHSVMDGKGTHSYLMDLFRVLKGERPLGANSRTYDWQLRETPFEREKPTPANSISPLGPLRNMDTSCQWLRVTIPIPYHQRLLVKLSRLLTQFACVQWENETIAKRLSYNIAVDLRRYLPADHISTANLTGFVKIPMDRIESDRDFQKRLAEAIRNNRALHWPKIVEPFSWLPSKLFQENAKVIANRYQNNRFHCSALISMMGKTQLTEMHYENFRAVTNYGVVSGSPGLPLFIGVCEGGNDGQHYSSSQAIEILMGAPNALGGMERLEKLGNYFRQNLMQSAPIEQRNEVKHSATA